MLVRAADQLIGSLKRVAKVSGSLASDNVGEYTGELLSMGIPAVEVPPT
jgi:hypothetical protein